MIQDRGGGQLGNSEYHSGVRTGIPPSLSRDQLPLGWCHKICILWYFAGSILAVSHILEYCSGGVAEEAICHSVLDSHLCASSYGRPGGPSGPGSPVQLIDFWVQFKRMRGPKRHEPVSWPVLSSQGRSTSCSPFGYQRRGVSCR